MPTRLTPLTEVHQTPGYAYATPRRLRRWHYDGDLAAFKVGGLLFIDLDELDAFVAEGRVTAHADDALTTR